MRCRRLEVQVRESGAVDVTCDGLDAGTVARCKVFAAFRVRLSQGQYEGVDVYMQQYRKLEQLPAEQPNGGCIYLHASLNQLTSLDGIIDFPHLVFCNFSSNLLQDISQLATLKYVQHADLGANAITDLPQFQPQSLLRSLNLSANMLECLQGLSTLTALEELDVSHNPMLTSIEPLRSLTQLRKLDVQSCQVVSIEPLGGCSQLNNINAARNNIVNLSEICSALAGMPALEQLVLKGNPVEADRSYLFSVVASGGALKLLDWSPITDEIRTRVAMLQVRQEKRVYVTLMDEWYSGEMQKTSQVVEQVRTNHRAKEKVLEVAAHLRLQRAEKELTALVHHIAATIPTSNNSSASHSEKLFDEWAINKSQEVPKPKEQSLRHFVDGRLSPKINPAELFQKMDSADARSLQPRLPPLQTRVSSATAQSSGKDTEKVRSRRKAAEMLSASALSFMFRSRRTSQHQEETSRTPRTDDVAPDTSNEHSATARSEATTTSTKSTPRVVLSKVSALSAFGFRRRNKRDETK